MKERPILFSGEMVKAILEGRKTQTRRIMKPQPSDTFLPQIGEYQRTLTDRKDGEQYPDPVVRFGASDENEDYPCPYGRPGDFLWVKENFKPRPGGIDDIWIIYAADELKAGFGAASGQVSDQGLAVYYRMLDRATKRMNQGKKPELRPNIYLPRWASRITLEITKVRVERLQSISGEDAKVEGIEPMSNKTEGGYKDYLKPYRFFVFPRDSYRSLWESINGVGSWEQNPFVWVVEFRRVKP